MAYGPNLVNILYPNKRKSVFREYLTDPDKYLNTKVSLIKN